MPKVSQSCAELLSDIDNYAKRVGNLDDVVKAIKVDCRPSKRGGRTRALSPYNKFIGSCVKGKSGPVKTRFRECAKEWRRKK